MTTVQSATEPIQCQHCGANLLVHMDRWNAEARMRQMYTCPACTKRTEGTFSGRVIEVTRRWKDT